MVRRPTDRLASLISKSGRIGPSLTLGLNCGHRCSVAVAMLNLSMSSRLDSQANRSEEHTSELQSLLRISYAVFCLKKKKTTQPTTTNYYQQSTQYSHPDNAILR